MLAPRHERECGQVRLATADRRNAAIAVAREQRALHDGLPDRGRLELADARQRRRPATHTVRWPWANAAAASRSAAVLSFGMPPEADLDDGRALDAWQDERLRRAQRRTRTASSVARSKSWRSGTAPSAYTGTPTTAAPRALTTRPGRPRSWKGDEKGSGRTRDGSGDAGSAGSRHVPPPALRPRPAWRAGGSMLGRRAGCDKGARTPGGSPAMRCCGSSSGG